MIRPEVFSFQQVTEDVEIQKWWEEIQLEGHPDTDPKDWPAIDSVAALQDIAASMMWTASCHHAGKSSTLLTHASPKLFSPQCLAKM